MLGVAVVDGEVRSLLLQRHRCCLGTMHMLFLMGCPLFAMQHLSLTNSFSCCMLMAVNCHLLPVSLPAGYAASLSDVTTYCCMLSKKF
jgi:hypothetical protein